MVDILHRVGIDALPDKVFQALTTIDGIRGWWSSEAHGSATAGEAFEFRRNHLDVIETEPNLVRWRYSGPVTEWVGTEIIFRLEWREIQAIVLFYHRGWKEPVEFMHHCSTKWATFLLSLKDLIETGVGHPEPDDTKIAVDG